MRLSVCVSGQTLSTAMVNAGLTTFSKIEQTNPRELELVSNSKGKLLICNISFLSARDLVSFSFYQIVNRHPPFGTQIRDSVLHLPKYEVILEQVKKKTSLNLGVPGRSSECFS